MGGLYVFMQVLKASYGHVDTAAYIWLVALVLWNTLCLGGILGQRVNDRRLEYFRRKAAEARNRRHTLIAGQLDSMVREGEGPK